MIIFNKLYRRIYAYTVKTGEKKHHMRKQYVDKKIQQYKVKKQRIVNSTSKLKGLEIRRKIHPFLRWVLMVKSKVCGLTYEIVENEVLEQEHETVIYAVTHIGKYDFEMIMEALPIVAYAFAGDWELQYGNIDDFFLRLNGVIYVDTEDKDDRVNSAKMMVKTLTQGMSVVIFPEGIWNLSESLPMQKIYSGTVLTAQEADVPIIPIAIEQRGKHFYINVGEKMNVQGFSKEMATQELRDTMATLRWKLWERFPLEKRANISKDWYGNFLKERLAEWPLITMEIIKGRVYQDVVDRELDDIKRDIEYLQSGKH